MTPTLSQVSKMSLERIIQVLSFLRPVFQRPPPPKPGKEKKYQVDWETRADWGNEEINKMLFGFVLIVTIIISSYPGPNDPI